MLPFASVGVDSSLAGQLSREAAQQLGKLKGNAHKGLTVIPLSKTLAKKVETIDQAGAVLGATHVLRGTLEPSEMGVTLRAYLTDVRYGVDAREWVADYR